ncbi:MAG: hypothetical protein HYY81_09585 [Deltaproteobacteria bacterium]|nr:hypothetical protein [Deltaproteobacteria bacterium]
MSFPRKSWTLFLSALLLALPAPLFSQGKTSKKIYVGVPAVSMGNIIIFFTKEAKLFEKHGLEAEVVVMQGSGIASRALVAGSVQISPIATPTVMGSRPSAPSRISWCATLPGKRGLIRIKISPFCRWVGTPIGCLL